MKYLTFKQAALKKKKEKTFGPVSPSTFNAIKLGLEICLALKS